MIELAVVVTGGAELSHSRVELPELPAVGDVVTLGDGRPYTVTHVNPPAGAGQLHAGEGPAGGGASIVVKPAKTKG